MPVIPNNIVKNETSNPKNSSFKLQEDKITFKIKYL